MTTLAVNIAENIPLHHKTSYAIGGNARYYCEPETTDDLLMALQFARREQLPLFLLGKGTNLLVSDDGWPGLVIHLTERLNGGTCIWNDTSVTVPGGFTLNGLVKESVEHGCSGLEELAGIPGTVGGAVVMNAGAFSTCIADTLSSVVCCTVPAGEIIRYSASELELTYRNSRIRKTGDIVVSAEFSLGRTGTITELGNRRREILDRRKSKQPLEYPNCGSVFKRPPGDFAGTLIEKCGLKGLRCGSAEVSTKHANFIVNLGRAQAGDVRHLIYTVQKTVWERCEVLLEPEVIFIGKFDEPLFIPPEKNS